MSPGGAIGNYFVLHCIDNGNDIVCGGIDCVYAYIVTAVTSFVRWNISLSAKLKNKTLVAPLQAGPRPTPHPLSQSSRKATSNINNVSSFGKVVYDSCVIRIQYNFSEILMNDNLIFILIYYNIDAHVTTAAEAATQATAVAPGGAIGNYFIHCIDNGNKIVCVWGWLRYSKSYALYSCSNDTFRSDISLSTKLKNKVLITPTSGKSTPSAHLMSRTTPVTSCYSTKTSVVDFSHVMFLPFW